MFKIAILLRLIDIINKLWHPLQTCGWNLNPLFLKNPIVTNMALFWFTCLINTNSFRKGNSIIIKHLYLMKLFLNIYHSSSYFYKLFLRIYYNKLFLSLLKTDLISITTLWKAIAFSGGKELYECTLILIINLYYDSIINSNESIYFIKSNTQRFSITQRFVWNVIN